MGGASMRRALLIGGAVWLGWAGWAASAWAQQPAPAAPGGDPFAQSQMQQLAAAGPVADTGVQFTVSGFVDAGYVRITQTGPKVPGGNISWNFGNSQFHFFSQASTFTLNEVDLTLDASRERDGLLYGARASIDYYPSRDTEAYSIPNSDREFDVDQGFVFIEWMRAWNTRLVVGRAPGFVTLEQTEADAPDFRMIGHTYVFQAGGGYPYGLQAITRPGGGLSLKLGIANGGIGAYSFFPGDTSTLNRGVARDADNASGSDQVSGQTGYAAVDWAAFDEPAGAGTLRLGVAGANASKLTYDPVAAVTKPYSFANVYGAYRRGIFEVRMEAASLEAYYEQSVGQFNADMAYLLLSLHLGADHLVTLRAEKITYKTDIDPDIEGDGSKAGVSYRYRIGDGMIVKGEAVREKQSPQFFVPNDPTELTTDVAAVSLVYSF